MTNDPDPLERAIEEAAGRMTAHSAPDLRARVAAALDHRTPARTTWWRPALATAAIAFLAWLLWRPTPPMETAPRHGTDIALRVPAAEPLPASAPALVADPPARREPPAEAAEAWPEMEPAIEPLVIEALTIEPLDRSVEPAMPAVEIAPIEIAPLAIAPLVLEPLAGPHMERRR